MTNWLCWCNSIWFQNTLKTYLSSILYSLIYDLSKPLGKSLYLFLCVIFFDFLQNSAVSWFKLDILRVFILVILCESFLRVFILVILKYNFCRFWKAIFLTMMKVWRRIIGLFLLEETMKTKIKEKLKVMVSPSVNLNYCF